MLSVIYPGDCVHPGTFTRQIKGNATWGMGTDTFGVFFASHLDWGTVAPSLFSIFLVSFDRTPTVLFIAPRQIREIVYAVANRAENFNFPGYAYFPGRAIGINLIGDLIG